jgi:hypothetical protein
VHSLLKIEGRFCESLRRLPLKRAGRAVVTGRKKAAALCLRGSLGANMDHYNIRVNGVVACDSSGIGAARQTCTLSY